MATKQTNSLPDRIPGKSHNHKPQSDVLRTADLDDLPDVPDLAPESDDWTALTARVLERVRQCVEDALDYETPETALLKTSQALLFRNFVLLNDAFEQAISDPVNPVRHVTELYQAIDLMLRLARQIDRFGQLQQLLLEARDTLPAQRRQ